ncbi:hypothetical protein GCM10029992_22180 [Glycomyces albus]
MPVERIALGPDGAAVPERGDVEQLAHAGVLAGLLVDLAEDRGLGRLAEIDPASGQVPGASAGIAVGDAGKEDPPGRVGHDAVGAEALAAAAASFLALVGGVGRSSVGDLSTRPASRSSASPRQADTNGECGSAAAVAGSTHSTASSSGAEAGSGPPWAGAAR